MLAQLIWEQYRTGDQDLSRFEKCLKDCILEKVISPSEFLDFFLDEQTEGKAEENYKLYIQRFVGNLSR